MAKDILISTSEVCRLAGYKRAAAWYLYRKKGLPKPAVQKKHPNGSIYSYWYKSTIDAWLKKYPPRQQGEEIPAVKADFDNAGALGFIKAYYTDIARLQHAVYWAQARQSLGLGA